MTTVFQSNAYINIGYDNAFCSSGLSKRVRSANFTTQPKSSDALLPKINIRIERRNNVLLDMHNLKSARRCAASKLGQNPRSGFVNVENRHRKCDGASLSGASNIKHHVYRIAKMPHNEARTANWAYGKTLS